MKITPFLGILEKLRAKREPLADDIDDLWVYKSLKGPDYGFEIQLDKGETVTSITLIFVSDWSLRPSLYPPGQGPYSYLEEAAKKPTPKRRIALVEQLFQTLMAQLGLKVPEIAIGKFQSAEFTLGDDCKSLNWEQGREFVRVSLYEDKVTAIHYRLGDVE